MSNIIAEQGTTTHEEHPAWCLREHVAGDPHYSDAAVLTTHAWHDKWAELHTESGEVQVRLFYGGIGQLDLSPADALELCEQVDVLRKIAMQAL